MDQINLDAWTGRITKEQGAISEQTAAQYSATLGSEDTLAHGDVAPPLSHWCVFTPTTATHVLGADGHPRGDALIPPMPAKRRMWAGGALRFHGPLHVGDRIERMSALRSVQQKEGASGQMIFVTLDHAIYGPQGLAIQERQDIVYLDMPTEYAPPKKRPMDGRMVKQVDPSEALLFRYSALTFNAHRIHYDRPYAMEVEKYPGLVVHGPLQASLLMQTAIAHKGRMPSDFSFKGVHPMFAGTPMEIALREEDGAFTLMTGQDGHQGMVATVLWEDTQ